MDRVAYQGVPGAYSESAALKACPGWTPLPCEQFEVAFQALSQVGGWAGEQAAGGLMGKFGTPGCTCEGRGSCWRTKLVVSLWEHQFEALSTHWAWLAQPPPPAVGGQARRPATASSSWSALLAGLPVQLAPSKLPLPNPLLFPSAPPAVDGRAGGAPG